MTFIYFVKKLTEQWIKQMSKADIAKTLVIQESLSASSAKVAFRTNK